MSSSSGLEPHLEKGQVPALLPMRPEAPHVSEGASGAITHCHTNPSHVIPAADGQSRHCDTVQHRSCGPQRCLTEHILIHSSVRGGVCPYQGQHSSYLLCMHVRLTMTVAYHCCALSDWQRGWSHLALSMCIHITNCCVRSLKMTLGRSATIFVAKSGCCPAASTSPAEKDQEKSVTLAGPVPDPLKNFAWPSDYP